MLPRQPRAAELQQAAGAEGEAVWNRVLAAIDAAPEARAGQGCALIGRVGLSLAAIALLAVVVPAAVLGEEIVGQAAVIDGDTLEIRGQRIRLHGVDAPESAQRCALDGESYSSCGQTAAFVLANRISRQTVARAENDRDRYGRIVAV